ncbi:MAG: hypothetical protein RLZZ182_1389 [Pseudomonadota bacterium]|jgi:uncharacterized protein VirK/YbjX
MSGLFTLPSTRPADAPAGAWVGRLLNRLHREVAERGVSGVLNLLGLYGQVCLNFRQHQRWLRVLQQEPGREAARGYDRLAYRYTLPCLSTAFGRQARLEALAGHYEWVQSRFRVGFAHWVCSGDAQVWHREEGGHRMSVHLLGLCARSRHREGELTLSFRLDGQALCHLSFSFIPREVLETQGAVAMPRSGLDCVPYIGRVQGEPSRYELFRLATQSCQDTSPVDVLMRCLGGVAQALGIDLIAGVDSAHNISHQSLATRTHGFDYEAFWARHGAVHLGHGHHALAWPIEDKPIADIAAKHRQRTLRKRQFKQGVAHEVAERLKPWVI